MRRRIGWLIVPFCWALACGGRFEQTADGDGAGATSTGQGGSTPSKAGASSRGGNGARAGATGNGGSTPIKVGGTGGSPPVGRGGSNDTGGVIGASGTSDTASEGGYCACDPIACALPYVPVLDADGCCFHCELNLASCKAQRNSYYAFRDEMLKKYASINCQVSADCGVYFEKNACGTDCGVALPNVGRQELEEALNAYAATACNLACPQQDQPLCGGQPTVADCWKGYCE